LFRSTSAYFQTYYVLACLVNFSNIKPATVTEIQTKVLESFSLGPKDWDMFQALRCWQNGTLYTQNVYTFRKLLCSVQMTDP